MKQKSQLFLYGILTSLIIVAFVYNIETLAAYVSSSFGKFFLSNNWITPFILITLLCYFSFIYAIKKFSQSITITFIGLAIPILILESTTIIEGMSLVPLRFPFGTIFPILGLLGGMVKMRRARKVFILYTFLCSIFLFCTHFFFIPRLTDYILARESKKIITQSPFTNDYFFTAQGDSVKLIDIVKAKCQLIELYFVGCIPCEQKMPSLTAISDSVNTDKFGVFFICNGTITNFEKFQTHAKKNEKKGFYFLYDKNSVINKITTSNSYPHEIILNGRNEIVSTFTGFNNISAPKYVNETIKKIKLILNE